MEKANLRTKITSFRNWLELELQIEHLSKRYLRKDLDEIEMRVYQLEDTESWTN